MSDNKFDSNGLFVSPNVISDLNIEVSDEAVKRIASEAIHEDQWPKLKTELEFHLKSVCVFHKHYKRLPNWTTLTKQLDQIKKVAVRFQQVLNENSDGVHRMCDVAILPHVDSGDPCNMDKALDNAKTDVKVVNEILSHLIKNAEIALKRIKTGEDKVENKQSNIDDPTDWCTRSILAIWQAMEMEPTMWGKRSGIGVSPFIDFASRVYVLVGIDNEPKAFSTIRDRIKAQMNSGQRQ